MLQLIVEHYWLWIFNTDLTQKIISSSSDEVHIKQY